MSKTALKRQLSPYERNHLLRHGVDPETIDRYGEMPVEYITQSVMFYGHEFYVDEQVLIPRVETEELVDLVSQAAQELSARIEKPLIVADVGTGSGAIGICLALELVPKKVVETMYLCDVSTEALRTARVNAQILGDAAQIYTHFQFVEGTLLNQLDDEIELDMIVANLPYVPTKTVDNLASSVIDFEPRIALDGGEDGLHLITELVTHATKQLSKYGQIWLEIDETHTLKKLQQVAKNYMCSILKDSFGKRRFAKLELGN